jgi:hypothetical protein
VPVGAREEVAGETRGAAPIPAKFMSDLDTNGSGIRPWLVYAL